MLLTHFIFFNQRLAVFLPSPLISTRTPTATTTTPTSQVTRHVGDCDPGEGTGNKVSLPQWKLSFKSVQLEGRVSGGGRVDAMSAALCWGFRSVLRRRVWVLHSTRHSSPSSLSLSHTQTLHCDLVSSPPLHQIHPFPVSKPSVQVFAQLSFTNSPMLIRVFFLTSSGFWCVDMQAKKRLFQGQAGRRREGWRKEVASNCHTRVHGGLFAHPLFLQKSTCCCLCVLLWEKRYRQKERCDLDGRRYFYSFFTHSLSKARERAICMY